MSFPQLVKDLNEAIPKALAEHSGKDMAPDEKYNVVLVGHSLGGSLITAIDSAKLNVLCTIVIDITEQTALASLGSMRTILARKPTHFKSQNELLQHYLRSRTLA